MSKPNILFIFMDDMGWRDLGCAGSTFYETPNIDALCAQGMRFDRAYAACPVCSPSRASYLSGRYPARLGVTDWIDWSYQWHPLKGKLIDAPYLHDMPEDQVTIAQALREGGYQTWHVGKWHLGGPEHGPERFGFDVNIGGNQLGMPHKGYFSPYYLDNLPDGPDGEYLTDRLTDEAIRLVDTAGERPFFLSLCHYAVHTPIQAKASDIERFERKRRDLGLDEQTELVPGEYHPTTLHGANRTVRRMIQSDPAYAAMIWNLDENVGRLVDALKRAGKFDDTLIVFTSDNGGLSTAEGSPTCNAPASEGKGWMFEGGTRVPMFATWPGRIAPGSICHEPMTTPDFYPTFLDVAQLPPRPTQHVDGMNLMPALQGEQMPERPLFWHYPHYGNQGGTPGGSVLLGRYKLIEFFEDGHLELYDLESDISERRNLSLDQPDRTQHLAELLHAWQRDVGAIFPQKNEDI